MAKTGYPGPSDALDRYEAIVATNEAVTRKGDKIPYTSRNGHMFSFLDASGVMALRLPKDLGDEFLSVHDSSIAEQYGRKMKEYVVVPDALLDDPQSLRPWFDQSHDWIGTLKPKPPRRGERARRED